MKEYRTQAQWIEICEAAVNGNWNIAGLIAAERGFFAEDLVSFWQDEEEHILELGTDLVFIAELAQQFRAVAKTPLIADFAALEEDLEIAFNNHSKAKK